MRIRHLAFGALLLSGMPASAGSSDDRDGDGVPNKVDQCRKEPETKNGFKDDDGCPDEIPRLLFVATFEGEPQPDAVLLVRGSTVEDTWVRGAYEARSLPGEVWSIEVRGGTCLSGETKVVTGDTHRTVEIPLAMNESASVIVEPVAPDGGFQTGVQARYENMDPMCPSATFPVERDKGHLLAAGVYTVHLSAPGAPDQRWTVDLDEGEEVRLKARFGQDQKLLVDHRGARVWVPWPVADWVRPTDPLITDLAPGTPVRVTAPGHRGQTVILNGETHVALDPIGEGATVVLIGSASDALSVDDAPVELGDDGKAMLPLPAGDHTLTVVGGGRTRTHPLALDPGSLVYLRDTPPTAYPILYARDRVIPDGKGLALVERLAGSLGRYKLRVVPYLPREGNLDYDTKLATQRGLVVYEALIAAGIPADRLEVAQPHTPFEGDATQQRRLEIVPVPM